MMPVRTYTRLLLFLSCFQRSSQLFGAELPPLEGGDFPMPPPPPPTSSGGVKPKVAVYYYPWWGDDFHRGAGYLRDELEPPQQPTLGEYDDTDPAVISQHLSWSRQANIKVWIGAWWGPNKREDVTLLNHIMVHPELGDMEISLLYETRGRIPEVVQADNTTAYSLDNVIPDMQHIALNYFSHPNYLRINGRPVVFIYVSRWLTSKGLLEEVVNRMRATALSYGEDVFVVGDQVWRDAPADPYPPYDLLDGVTNYDVYGNMQLSGDMYARPAKVQRYHDRQVAWRNACQGKCAFFPSITPGFHKTNKVPLSRKLDETAEYGSLFRTMLDNAKDVLDPVADLILVITSFNEWHEDTQIEPVLVGADAPEFGDLFGLEASLEGFPSIPGDTKGTDLPTSVTSGLRFEAYGELYLDILRDATS